MLSYLHCKTAHPKTVSRISYKTHRFVILQVSQSSLKVPDLLAKYKPNFRPVSCVCSSIENSFLTYVFAHGLKTVSFFFSGSDVSRTKTIENLGETRRNLVFENPPS